MLGKALALVVATSAVLVGRVPAPTAQSGSDPSCLADFDSMQVIVARDYAGYADKVPGQEAGLAALTDSVRRAATGAADVWACTDALARWIRWFRDHHLSVSGPPRPRPADAAPAAPPLSPLGISFPDDSTAVLRLPSFGQNQRRAIDSLVAAHRGRLLATPYLIVDIRRNGGGGDVSYAGVMRLIYTDSIFKYGFELWASDGNLAWAKQVAQSRPGGALSAEETEVLARLGANRGRFVSVGGGGYVRYDTVHALPRSVGIIADRRCASSCEQFILDARHSRKVTTYGAENTGGLLDYGQVRTVPLPSGTRRVGIPTSRSLRVVLGRFDNVGITPDIYLPVGAEPVPLVSAHLKNREPGSKRPAVRVTDAAPWADNPAIPPGGKNAVILGAPPRPGPYLIGVRFPDGYRLMPHTHPEDRSYTVVSGTWYIGIGETFDAAQLRGFPPGTVYLLPAGTPHFHEARSGEFVVQVEGTGPSGIRYVNPADDPRRR
jgi:hypothetical protein